METRKQPSRLIVHGPNGRKWGRNPRQLKAADLEAEGIKPMPALAIMRAMCLDCRCGQKDEVVTCAKVDCPLWPYRLGTNPFKAGTINTGLQAIRERTSQQNASTRAPTTEETRPEM